MNHEEKLIVFMLFMVSFGVFCISVLGFGFTTHVSKYYSTYAEAEFYVQPHSTHGNQFYAETVVRGTITPVTVSGSSSYVYSTVNNYVSSCSFSRIVQIPSDSYKMIGSAHKCRIRCAYEGCSATIGNYASYH